jgi:hypothetical protein
LARLSLLGHKIPIDGGGITSSGPAGWYGVEFGGYRYRTIEVYGTTVSGSWNVEVTLDPNSVMVDNAGNLISGAVGHADAATIPAYVVATGVASSGLPQVYDLSAATATFIGQANIVAVRLNFLTYGGTGTFHANLSVVP